MNPRPPPSKSDPGNHFVDIHEVVMEEEEEEDATQTTRQPDRNNRLNRFREFRPRHHHHVVQRGFNRQVSLETGFSVLNRDSKASDERKVLRSGLSLGGLDRVVGEAGGKGDYSLFRTKSSLNKQHSLMPLRKERDRDRGDNVGDHGHKNSVNENNNNTILQENMDDAVNQSVPAGRYFAALRGPELDEVKEYEDILLPKDRTWPFLLRFPIGCYGICLGLSSQAVLWRALATSPATQFLHVSPIINLAIWLLALLVLLSVTTTYLLKCIFYFEAVRREYFHPVRLNFFFAPWVVCMFLAIGAPRVIAPGPIHPAVWCAVMAPYFFLELKIYGQWLSGGKRRLCMVANPSSHLSVVGNFVGAILAARVGWMEPAKFFWAVGFAHYLVVFVTLYQRLPTSEALPKELHPVYSMFIAAPSAASIAWEAIYKEFDGLSRTCFFIALFLYMSLVVRINFFTGFRFSVAWWSYTFPMTTISVATIKYAEHVPCVLSKGLALSLSFTSSTMVAVLCVFTLLHAFVWRTLFPNDLAIAITKKRHGKETKRPTTARKGYDLRRWTKNITKKGSDKENGTDE